MVNSFSLISDELPGCVPPKHHPPPLNNGRAVSPVKGVCTPSPPAAAPVTVPTAPAPTPPSPHLSATPPQIKPALPPPSAAPTIPTISTITPHFPVSIIFKFI